MIRTQEQIKKDLQTFDDIIVSLKKQLKYIELSRYEMNKQLNVLGGVVPNGILSNLDEAIKKAKPNMDKIIDVDKHIGDIR